MEEQYKKMTSLPQRIAVIEKYRWRQIVHAANLTKLEWTIHPLISARPQTDEEGNLILQESLLHFQLRLIIYFRQKTEGKQ